MVISFRIYLPSLPLELSARGGRKTYPFVTAVSCIDFVIFKPIPEFLKIYMPVTNEEYLPKLVNID